MGRAFGVVCGRCHARLTVFESDGRVGISPNTRDEGPADPDATLPPEQDGEDHWPSCPACGAAALRHDPHSTDLTFPDEPGQAADRGLRRRRTDQLHADPDPTAGAGPRRRTR